MPSWDDFQKCKNFCFWFSFSIKMFLLSKHLWNFESQLPNNHFHIKLNLFCFSAKALDVWAMGVTLYCFVFGEVSWGKNINIFLVLVILLKSTHFFCIHSVHLWMSAFSVFIKKSRRNPWCYQNSKFCLALLTDGCSQCLLIQCLLIAYLLN